MKQLISRRILSMILALTMVVGLLPAGLAVGTEDGGVTAMSEAYEPKESLAPKGNGFTIDELLAWTPETDPDAAYSRASIPLQDRQGGFQVNPLSNPEAQLMLCANNDNPRAQGSESMLSYAFNYWQYVDSYIYWGGNGEALIQVPTGEVIDAAHTNGVPIVGTLGFPWGSGYGYVEQVSTFCQKDEDGSFPVADKLIELMEYYGFDGWFFNQESYGCSAEIAARLNEMMRYMHEKRPEIVISWYDSMTEGGGVSYQDAVNDTNKFWMAPNEKGYWGVDEFFMNYNWYEYDVTQTINTLKSIGRSQYDAFAGFNMQANVYGDLLRDHLLVDEDGVAKLSLALYYANQTQTVAKDGVDFHKTEQGYYVGAAGDPRDTSVDVANSRVSTWPGMSRLFADKSPITAAPFVTDFNTGHGKYWFVSGEKVRDAEWSYQSNQDVLPTFTWIIDSEGSKLSGSYDFEDAFNGGSSVKFSGTLDARNDILLYSTFVDVANGMKLNLTAKGGLENASLVAYLGDASAESYEDCQQVAFELTEGEGWVETVCDLSAYAGQTLYGIGLQVEGDVADYALNLGRLSIIDKNRNGGNGPSDLRVEAIEYADPYTAEARIRWSKVTGASSYEIYKVHADGSKTFIMETPNTAYYIPVLTRDADETDVTVEVVPVNRNGVRGKASKLVIDWALSNADGDRLVQEDSVNVNLGATVTGYSEQGDGAECDKALDGVSGNASKWWASGRGDWFSIDLGEPKTIKRVRMEHAEAGGEGKDLNTSAYTIYYKDGSGNWAQALKVTGNTDAVNDLLLDTPVTAQEWKLVIDGIGPSPWSAVNIYEWQMFETGFPATEPVAMRYASAFNGEGAADTFTLKNVPATRTVKVYNAEGTVIGETTGSGTVELTGLDFGTADAGRIFYTVTETGRSDSAKFSAPFEAENAAKSEPAEDVEFVKYSQPGSVSSSVGTDIYTTVTVKGLTEGDVVYVLGDEPMVSLPVAAGKTSVSIEGVRIARRGGELAMQVKRVGSLISDVYYVDTPVFAEPTASIQVFAVNEAGETLTGVRFDVVDQYDDVIAQMSTTSDSGARIGVMLGTYTIRNTESPEGYGLAGEITAIARIEGWTNVYTVVIPEAGEPEETEPVETEPVETEPVETEPVIDPADDSRDIPLDVLTVSAGDWQTGYETSEGPAELAVDNNANTLWHTNWYGTSNENHWFQFELTADYNVDGLRYQPRQSGNDNGTITEYDIQVSEDGENFFSITSGNWDADRSWKIATFPSAHVKYVRLVSLEAVSDNSFVFASAAEIRLTGEVYVDPMPPQMEADDDSRDIPVSILTATAGDWERNGGASEGPAELVLDGDYNTLWHTDWKGTSRENHWIQFELGEEYYVDGLRYKPRAGGSANGNITEYDIQVSDDGETFRSVVTGNWAGDSTWKIAQFSRENVKYVRLVSLNAVSDNSWVFASAAEIRLTGQTTEISNADKTALNALIAECEQIEQGNYTAKSWQDFQKALERARTVSASPYASQTRVDEAYEDLLQAKAGLKEKVEGEGVQKIFHLDSGRKYFSKDWTIALLNELSAAGYTHLQLAFGNNGFRFILDDMSIEANDTVYDSVAIKEGIKIGNANYYDEGDVHALTEAEMDEILAHAASVGVQIVPHLNMPGHMSALLDAMDHIGIENAHFTGYVQSDSSVNLNNQEALNFMLALVDKYAKYFSDAGCKYFHVGADEYANDAYNGNMGFPSIGSALYEKFADFVNDTAAIVKGYGMTPRAWNDGVYYGSYTAEFDSDIEITYWSAGWWGYDLAKTSKFIEKGNGLINTNGGYYYILGVDDVFTEGNSKTHTPGVYMPAEGFDVHRFADSSTVDEPVGGMFCVWADYPGTETETEVAANIRLLLRAMALRMEGLDLDGMNTGIVEGGFNEDGTINGAGETPDPETVDKTKLNELIEQAESINMTDIDMNKWSEYEAMLQVLDAAKAVSRDADATQDEVDAAADALAAALAALEFNPTYNVIIAELEHGTITAQPAQAHEGQTVTLIVTPDEGYALVAGSLRVNDIAIDGNTFTMPGRDVTVTAEFEEVSEDALKAAEEAAATAEAAAAAAEEAAAAAEAAQAAADEAGTEEAQIEAAEAKAAAEAAQKAAEDAQAAAEAAAAAAEANDAAAAQAAAEAAKHAQKVAELNAEIAELKAEMAEYLKDAQKAAEEAEEHNKAAAEAALAAAKYEALIELALAVDPDDYDDAAAALLEEAINAGIEAINAAETIEAVQEALADVLAQIEVLTKQMPFVDVPADSFYAESVLWAVANGITNGTSETTFSPNKTITRAEAITFLWRAAGKPEPAATVSPFVDVTENDFFFKAVLWAVEEGIANGLDQSHFGPYATANRAQVVTFLWRANGSPAASVENPFTDVADNAWFHDAVLWALENGVTTGASATFFDAWGSCNRAQVVTFLYRAAK